jgi:excisionase family DNA binding protein
MPSRQCGSYLPIFYVFIISYRRRIAGIFLVRSEGRRSIMYHSVGGKMSNAPTLDPRTPPQQEGISKVDTAVMLGIGLTTVNKLIREGRLRSVKLGRRTIVPRSEVLRLLAGR